jgi:hypothetical protein
MSQSGNAMMPETDIHDFVARRLADPETGWSLGTFGAIAEFTRDADEPVELSDTPVSLSAVTARGGVRIHRVAHMRPFASESTTRESWNQRIALCLPVDACTMSRRTALTELGPDAAALRQQDRDAILFDLGLDTVQVDVCIRVAEPAVAAQLRVLVGRGLFERGNPAMGIILAANPHRVFISRLGRIEVFQPIPTAGGTSPEGPHTHVLPRLLQHRRTHAATEPVPEGWVPCAHLYPPHPTKDDMGRVRPFDPMHHDNFQQLLRMFGDPTLVALKQRVVAAVEAGENPGAVSLLGHRHAHASIRVALRQMRASRNERPALAAWMAAHEPRTEKDLGDEELHLNQ